MQEQEASSSSLNSDHSGRSIGYRVAKYHTYLLEQTNLESLDGNNGDDDDDDDYDNNNKSSREVALLSWNDVDAKEIIGQGSTCIVEKASYGALECAMKSVRGSLMKREKRYTDAAMALVSEAFLLSRLQHNNIVEIYGVKRGAIRTAVNQQRYFLVQEYLKENLEDRLDDWLADEGRLFRGNGSGGSGRKVKLRNRLESVALGIAKALEYLHSKNVIFRDLRPSKIGFDSDGTPKLFGFTSAVELMESNSVRVDLVGTLRYMAPEVLTGQWYREKVDVYSFGILLWEIATLQKPFYQLSTHDQFQEVVVKKRKRPQLTTVSWNPLRVLIDKCWDQEPAKRLSFEEIVKALESIIEDLRGKTKSKRHLLTQGRQKSVRKIEAVATAPASPTPQQVSAVERGTNEPSVASETRRDSFLKRLSISGQRNNDVSSRNTALRVSLAQPTASFADIILSELAMEDRAMLEEVAEQQGRAHRRVSEIQSSPSQSTSSPTQSSTSKATSLQSPTFEQN